MPRPPTPSSPTPGPPRKLTRNEPCPCGSGKKYKRCCALLPPGTQVVIWDDDDMDQLDELTNQVPMLIRQGHFDEAEGVCHELKRRWPDMVDWRDRFAALHEARGEYAKAAEHYRLAVDYARTHDGFDEGGIADWIDRAEHCESKT